MRPPGGEGSRHSDAGVAFTFIAPTGFPPRDSHACCTPWSVFQDGSDAAIRAPTTTAQGATDLPSDRRIRQQATARSDPRGRLPDESGPAPPRGGLRCSCEELARLSSVASRSKTRRRAISSPRAKRRPPTHDALLAREQLPLAGSPQKCRSVGERPATARKQPRRGETTPTSLEPDGEPLQPHSFPSQRFRGLFDSLFKVLFTFPSRYLFAIGLVPVFSFRWSLPPTLGCIPKQPDSPKTVAARPGGVAHGALTLSDVPFQVNFDSADPGTAASPGHNSPTQDVGDFRLELFPLRSPLLGESLLVSLPPLIDMLKFSG